MEQSEYQRCFSNARRSNHDDGRRFVLADCSSEILELFRATKQGSDLRNRCTSNEFVLVEEVFVLRNERRIRTRKLVQQQLGVGVVDEDANLGRAIGSARNAAHQVRKASTDKPIDVGITREDLGKQPIQASFGGDHGRSFASSRRSYKTGRAPRSSTRALMCGMVCEIGRIVQFIAKYCVDARPE